VADRCLHEVVRRHKPELCAAVVYYIVTVLKLTGRTVKQFMKTRNVSLYCTTPDAAGAANLANIGTISGQSFVAKLTNLSTSDNHLLFYNLCS
jgi:hypothetical protein